MDIVELKKKLENNKLDNTFLVFVLQGDKQDQSLEDRSSYIIAEQYIKKICDIKHLRRKTIESISEIPDDSFIIDDNLYIIKTDEWNTSETHDNCIIICKSSKEDNIKIPNLQEWQLVDYVIPRLKGLQKSDIEDLIKRYTTSHGTNYQRFLRDVEKIESFEPGLQTSVYYQMLDSGDFDTTTNLTIFDLSNAVKDKDISKISQILHKMKYTKDFKGKVNNDYYIDIEPLGLLTLLYREFKRLLIIKTNPHCTCDEAGCKSDKQLWYLRNHIYYTAEQLEGILRKLTNIEYMYKLGGLEQNQLIDYLIVNVLGE